MIYKFKCMYYIYIYNKYLLLFLIINKNIIFFFPFCSINKYYILDYCILKIVFLLILYQYKSYLKMKSINRNMKVLFLYLSILSFLCYNIIVILWISVLY